MEQLIERLAAGDDAALAELYDRYGRVAFAVARRILRSDELAEDAVQEAFLSLWRTADRYTASRSAAKTWILVLVHRRAVDILRSEERRRRPVPDAALPALSGEGEAMLHEEARRARRALQHLAPPQRVVIELAYFGGLTQSEIAVRTGEPLGTVKSRTWSGLRRLRELLEQEESPEARVGAGDFWPSLRSDQRASPAIGPASHDPAKRP